MPTCKILFFLLLALCVLCGKCDDVLYQQVGGEVSMDCKIPPKFNQEWKFNDQRILVIHEKSGTTRKGHTHLSEKAVAKGETLKIPRLETRDSGVYFCLSLGKRFILHVVSVFATPGPVLPQSSDAELHCDITGNPKVEVQWLNPSEQIYDKQQVIHLKSVTSKEEGQWTCVVGSLKLTLNLAVVGLQTRAVEVSEGKEALLPCSLPQSVSQRVVGGKWKADHLPTDTFPTLKNSEGLHWDGENSSKIIYTRGQLGINYDVTLTEAQHNDEGKFVCTVEFEGGVTLTAETNLTVVAKTSGGQEGPKGKGKTPAGGGIWTKNMYGLQLWIWIVIGVSSVFVIGLVVTVFILKRRKRMKTLQRKRSMRQLLAAKHYCKCKSSVSEME